MINYTNIHIYIGIKNIEVNSPNKLKRAKINNLNNNEEYSFIISGVNNGEITSNSKTVNSIPSAVLNLDTSKVYM